MGFASHGDVLTVRFLLEHGASVISCTMDGRTPIEVADPSVVDILFAATPPPAMVEAPKPDRSANCASQAAIAKLPVSNFKAVAGDAIAEGEMCQICLDEFGE